jgi:sugar-specific transcriptional regulator TrmB
VQLASVFEEALHELGLTPSQSKIYLILAQYGSSLTAKYIADLSQLARQDVYLILGQLFNLGLIEKELEYPTRYISVPIFLLLERKLDKISQLRDFIRESSKKKGIEKLNEHHITVIPFGKYSQNKVLDLIRNSSRHIDVFSSIQIKFLKYLLDNYLDDIKQTVTKGVAFRFLIDKSLYKEMKKIAIIPRELSFRFLDLPPNINFAVFDSSQAVVNTSPGYAFPEAPSLWTDNPNIVGVLQDYFKTIWKEKARVARYKRNLVSTSF